MSNRYALPVRELEDVARKQHEALRQLLIRAEQGETALAGQTNRAETYGLLLKEALNGLGYTELLERRARLTAKLTEVEAALERLDPKQSRRVISLYATGPMAAMQGVERSSDLGRFLPPMLEQEVRELAQRRGIKELDYTPPTQAEIMADLRQLSDPGEVARYCLQQSIEAVQALTPFIKELPTEPVPTEEDTA